MAALTETLLALAVLGAVLWWHIHVPFSFPKDIPKVPIYVSLLGLWSDLGQDEIYDRWLREPLERYGAVNFWFAGQWSIIFARPEYFTDLFRNEDIYAKAGNQKKIHWTVIATLLGDNIISAHGNNWKIHTSIVKPGISKRTFDSRPLLDKSRKFVDLLLQEQANRGRYEGVLVNPLIQRYAIAAMGESFLDIDFHCLENPNAPILLLQTAIKASIFKPLYLNFPILDKWPQLFTSRKDAFKLVKEFENLLYQLVRNRPRNGSNQKQLSKSDMLINLLDDALDSGWIADRQYRNNLKIIFITGHENVQLLLSSLFWELGRNQEVQRKLREEILATKVANPTADTVNKLPYMSSVIFELLRPYPPISQLTNRIATEDAVLGGDIASQHIPILDGMPTAFTPASRSGVHRLANSSLSQWGKTVEETQLEFRRDCVRGAFIPFNAHTRKCLGQGFVLLEMKIVMFEMVSRVCWRLDPTYNLKLPGAGVLAPVRCKVIVEEYCEVEKEPREVRQIDSAG